MKCSCCGSINVQTSHGGRVRTCLDCGHEEENVSRKTFVVMVGKISPGSTTITAIEGALRTESAWDDEKIIWCQKCNRHHPAPSH